MCLEGFSVKKYVVALVFIECDKFQILQKLHDLREG